uniref:Uncharacterized protein n=1 Tax=Oryzias latipes TaxID=8090 RepID=A0A3B3IND2_ORYLA
MSTCFPVFPGLCRPARSPGKAGRSRAPAARSYSNTCFQTEEDKAGRCGLPSCGQHRSRWTVSCQRLWLPHCKMCHTAARKETPGRQSPVTPQSVRNPKLMLQDHRPRCSMVLRVNRKSSLVSD